MTGWRSRANSTVVTAATHRMEARLVSIRRKVAPPPRGDGAVVDLSSAHVEHDEQHQRQTEGDRDPQGLAIARLGGGGLLFVRGQVAHWTHLRYETRASALARQLPL